MIMPEQPASLHCCTIWAGKHLKRDDLWPSLSLLKNCKWSLGHAPSRYCLSMTFRQIQTGKDSDKYSFFPLAIVQWNALPESVVIS